MCWLYFDLSPLLPTQPYTGRLSWERTNHFNVSWSWAPILAVLCLSLFASLLIHNMPHTCVRCDDVLQRVDEPVINFGGLPPISPQFCTLHVLLVLTTRMKYYTHTLERVVLMWWHQRNILLFAFAAHSIVRAPLPLTMLSTLGHLPDIRKWHVSLTLIVSERCPSLSHDASKILMRSLRSVRCTSLDMSLSSRWCFNLFESLSCHSCDVPEWAKSDWIGKCWSLKYHSCDVPE